MTIRRETNRTRSLSVVGADKRPEDIRAICDVLGDTYRNPRHGNKADPLDELIYIILSLRSRNEAYQLRYSQLRERIGAWSRIDETSLPILEEILRPGGLGRLKATQIVAIMARLRAEFGGATLAPLRGATVQSAEAFLTSLPGVGSKVAKCVLMYSLGREVLPIDVHVHRVAARLGFRAKRRPDTSQDLIEAAIPPPLRYGFHVNAVAHGRAICVSHRPRCRSCVIARWCDYFHDSKGKDGATS
jgi:endonuclease III